MKALLFLADGFEEVEALTTADYLRRAGIDALLVSINGTDMVTGSHKIVVKADTEIGALGTDADASAYILPGGLPGATYLAASAALDALLKKAAAQGRLIAAICAAPAVVLAPKGLLALKNWTCYPGAEADVADTAIADTAGHKEERVVVDAGGSFPLITSRAPGTAGEFACAIIEKLVGKEKAASVARGALVK